MTKISDMFKTGLGKIGLRAARPEGRPWFKRWVTWWNVRTIQKLPTIIISSHSIWLKNLRAQASMSHFFPISRFLFGYFQKVWQRIGQSLYPAHKEKLILKKKSKIVTYWIHGPDFFYYMPFENITNGLPVRLFIFLKLVENSPSNLQFNFLFNSIYQSSVFNNFQIGFQIFQLKYSWFKYRFLTA